MNIHSVAQALSTFYIPITDSLSLYLYQKTHNYNTYGQYTNFTLSKSSVDERVEIPRVAYRASQIQQEQGIKNESGAVVKHITLC